MANVVPAFCHPLPIREILWANSVKMAKKPSAWTVVPVSGASDPPENLPCRATRSLKTGSRAFRRATPTHAPRRTHVTRANRSTMGGQTIDCVRTSPPISRALATSQPRTTRANRRLPRNCSHACSRNSRSNRAPSRHPRTTVADVPFSPTHRRAIASRSPRSPPATARTCSRARSRTSTSRRRV